MACQTCRLRKVKCDRVRPSCTNCDLRHIRCSYGGERRKRVKLADSSGYPLTGAFRFVAPYHGPPTQPDSSESQKSSSSNDELRRDIYSARSTLASDLAEGRSPLPASTPPSGPSRGTLSLNGDGTNLLLLAAAQTDSTQPTQPANLDEGNSLSTDTEDTSPFDLSPAPLGSGWLVDRILEGDTSDCRKDQHPALWYRTPEGDEYTGPSSGLSAISDPGLEWLRTHVQDSSRLCEMVSDIRADLLDHLHHPKCLPRELCPSALDHLPFRPLPSEQIISEYIDCYFERVQTVFPILDRAQFEQQRAAFSTDNATPSPSWLALLSAVVASGCRAALSDETSDGFQKSAREAWCYFANALSYETKLVNGATDLMAVQALAVMTVYAQGLSSPQRLEYTLTSTASRLAQSLALHVAAPAHWNLSADEDRERQRIFWVVYCLDKTVGLRCGRPSVIHDDEISCPFPQDRAQTSFGPGASSQTSFFLLFTRFARLCGQISLLLYSASALCLPPSQLRTAANQLLTNLEAWRLSVPTGMRPGRSFKCCQNASRIDHTQVLVLHFSYHYALCAIYKRFCPPFPDTDTEDPPLQLRSRITSLEAARSMLLLTKYLDTESYAPGWLSFYYPLVALTTIFLHVVVNPTDSHARNDIALMEVAVGLFGRLEFVTSGEAAFTKTREFVHQARHVVQKVSDRPATIGGMSSRGDAAPFLGFARHLESNELTPLDIDRSVTRREHDSSDQLSLDQDVALTADFWSDLEAMSSWTIHDKQDTPSGTLFPTPLEHSKDANSDDRIRLVSESELQVGLNENDFAYESLGIHAPLFSQGS